MEAQLTQPQKLTQISTEDLQQRIESSNSHEFSSNGTVRLHRHYGNMIPIMIDPLTKEPKYLLGPHFYVFGLALFVGMGVFVYIMSQLVGRASQWGIFGSIILGINFAYTYIKIGFSDPGIASRVDLPETSLQSSPKYCVPCRNIRSVGTSHCYYCDICIQEMDHHCPWVGKCIGKKNLCLFYRFLLSIGLLLGTLLIVALNSSPTPKANAVVKI